MANMFEDFRTQTPNQPPTKRPNMFSDFAPPQKVAPRDEQVVVDEFNALPWYARAGVAADDTMRLLANGASFGQADRLSGWLSGEGYDAEKAKTAEAKIRIGPAHAVADEIIGGGLSGYVLPAIGSGYLGAAGTGALYGGIDGGLRDAETWQERLGNAGAGAVAGGVLGPVAHGVADLAGGALNKVGQWWRYRGLEPDERAAAQISDLARQRFGEGGVDEMGRQVEALGPDAARVDVLGEPGRSLARKTANVSPEARETLTDFAMGRKDGQNFRLSGDIQRAGGMPPGDMTSVDKLKSDYYSSVSPQIGAAYDTARRAGSDFPLDMMKDIIDTPAGSEAFDTAFNNVATRAVTDGTAEGNLAVLDEMQRVLSKKATNAYNANDPQADVYAALARTIKERVDTFIQPGEVYSTARALRRDAYGHDNAFDVGARLGRRNVPFDALEEGRKVLPEHAPSRAKAYAQTKAEALANAPNTDGTLNQFTSRAGREAASVGVGEQGAQSIADAVAREKLYNLLPRALGNSTTVQQAIDTVGPGIDLATGALHLATAGKTAFLSHLARNAAGKVARAAATKATRTAAPSVAEALLKRNEALPAGDFYDPNLVELLGAGIHPLTAARILLGAAGGTLEGERGIASSFR